MGEINQNLVEKPRGLATNYLDKASASYNIYI